MPPLDGKLKEEEVHNISINKRITIPCHILVKIIEKQRH
jgi:hypothetical protein